jgi:cytochrome P450/NADPH-cytochrome P450 reductase
MINDRDPTTGEHLSDENIRYQMVTFLIAGHETTSGLLSFTTYYLLKNPRVLVKAREEADRAVHEAGGNLLAINASKLTYIDAVLKEALRLHSTAPLFTVTAKSPRGEVLPGGYFVKQGQSIGVLLHQLHRDPKVWGADAEEFRPERFLEGTYPPDSFKPFGNGARACIGRLFAVQEALLTVALMLHRFDLEMADPTYDLHLKQTLTIKPLDFKIVARPRFGRSQSLLMDLLSGSSIEKKAAEAEAKAAEAEAAAAAGGEKLTFLYGSNSGSCEGLARELAAEGASKGFSTAVGELDSVAGSGKLPTSGPVIICTASYEGKPTDNARLFVESITAETDSKSLKGVRYAVFGAGHHDWVQTFHKVPKFIDDRLEQLGAERLMPLTTADAGGDIVGDFEGFKTKVWDYFGKPVMAPKKGEQDATTAAEKPKAPQQLRIRVLPPTANPAATIISAGVETVGVVASQNVLVQHDTAHSQKNHIAIRLPEGQTYRSGDYLAILPKNPPSAVARALKRFDLKEGSTILLSETTSFIPTNAPIRAGDLFSSFVELGQPASRRSLEELASRCEGEDKAAVKKLVDAYAQEIIAQRVSLLDVFEKLPGHKADLSFFIENLPKMKIRQYS